jgi:hypothetical protein
MEGPTCGGTQKQSNKDLSKNERLSFRILTHVYSEMIRRMKKNLPAGNAGTTGSVRRSKRGLKHGERDINSVSSMTDVDLFQAIQGKYDSNMIRW